MDSTTTEAPAEPEMTKVLSPVSSIGQALQTLNVDASTSPTSSQDLKLRMSSVRRRLSLSMDLLMPPCRDMDVDSLDFTLRTPAKSKRFDPDENAEDNVASHGSPYKTPKRSAFCLDEREPPEFNPLRSSAPCVLSDIKNKPQQFRRAGKVPPSPLQRSCSFTSVKKIPRPWSSMSDLPFLPSTGMTAEPVVHQQPKSCILPTVSGSHPDLNCIAPETVVDLINGTYSNLITEHYIIDCRFPYEYDGGHIRTALNLTEKEIEMRFIQKPMTDRRVAILFHCEFSSKRAPSCYRFLRSLDRKANLIDYPKVYYPDIYLIEGGYKKFFELYGNTEHCQGGYVLMRDEKFFGEMKAHCKVSRSLKRTRSLSMDLGRSTGGSGGLLGL